MNHLAYVLFRVYPDGRIVRDSTAATLEDAMLAKSLMLGTGFTVTIREMEIDFDPKEASHLA